MNLQQKIIEANYIQVQKSLANLAEAEASLAEIEAQAKSRMGGLGSPRGGSTHSASLPNPSLFSTVEKNHTLSPRLGSRLQAEATELKKQIADAKQDIHRMFLQNTKSRQFIECSGKKITLYRDFVVLYQNLKYQLQIIKLRQLMTQTSAEVRAYVESFSKDFGLKDKVQYYYDDSGYIMNFEKQYLRDKTE